MILKGINMQKIMDSGQCFRIKKLDSNKYFVPSGEEACICVQRGMDIEIVATSSTNSEEYWKHYFDESYNYKDIEGRMSSCIFLSDMSTFGSGLRRLNQDPWECLVSYIISQRKSVKAISTAVEKLCKMYGKRYTLSGIEWYTFPTVKKLKEVYNSRGTYDASLGYRDDYVYSASVYSLDKEFIEYVSTLSYYEAKKELKKIHGVGDKVSDCVLLYSFGFNQAFPVDAWIGRYISNNDYFEDVNDLFKSEIGIVQLYIYYYMRNHKEDEEV